MELFETESRYFKNPNAKFAGIFSNLAVTITAVLIGIVLLVWFGISCWNGYREHYITQKVKHYVESCGFTIKGDFKLIDNMDAGSGQEQLRFVWLARNLKNPRLGDGEYYQYVRVVVTLRFWGSAKDFDIEKVALENLDYDKYVGNPYHILPDITNWAEYNSSIF